MKILWLCNVPLSSFSTQIGGVHNHEGGWLQGLSNDIVNVKEISLTYIFPFNKEVSGSVDHITFRSFRFSNNEKGLISFFTQIINQFEPDCIHIFGTEFLHTYSMIQACEKQGILDQTIISIQGLVSVYAKHFFAFLPQHVILHRTLYELIRKKGIKDQRDDFIRRGEFEKKSLKITHNVIGRTEWDYACVKQINPKVNYFFCNETLRPSFYKYSWDILSCRKHAIFVSQGNYPIKGFHTLLEAMPLILKSFPDAQIFTTLINPFSKKTFKSKLCEPHYTKYIRRLILKNNLKDNIIFLGPLNEEEMCQQLLGAHVFVCASSIENSSNSIGEAMLLGVPLVATFVGGTPTIVRHGEDGFLFPSDASYLLAHYVSKIMQDDTLAISISRSAKMHAEKTHNKEQNRDVLLSIYKLLRTKP